MNAQELKHILDQHSLWIRTDGAEGSRANLCDANLCDANLKGANLDRVIGADYTSSILY